MHYNRCYKPIKNLGGGGGMPSTPIRFFAIVSAAPEIDTITDHMFDIIP